MSQPQETFTQRVLDVVSKIPRGEMWTYKDVAAYAGSPGAARAVGNIMAHNWDPHIPCHRVVRADGKPGGYNRGQARKVWRLRQEDASV